MAENSAISWTDDTFNPWEGCQKVGPGCDGCYAEARNIRYAEKGATVAPNWGPGAPRRRTSAANWRKPLKWNREQAEAVRQWEARKAGFPQVLAVDPGPRPSRFVFCASLADVFDNAVPLEWRQDLFALIRATPHLTWLLLTKRPSMIERLWFKSDGSNPWPTNAAIGCTVVNQEEADRDIPALLGARIGIKRLSPTGPAFTFLSMEPLLGPVDGLWWHLPGPDWIITGGETSQGHHVARPAHPDWFRKIRDACADAGIPYHHKQNGEWMPGHTEQKTEILALSPEGLTRRNDGTAGFGGEIWVQKVGKVRAGRLLDGVEHNARPEIAHG